MNSPILRSRAVLLLATFLQLEAATAATIDRNGTANNLNTGAAWNNGIAPGASDIARWDALATGNLAQVMGGNLNWAGIVIGNPSGTTTVTIPDTGGFTLTLGSSGIDMTGAVDNNLAINAALNLSAPQNWNVASGRTLTYGTDLIGALSGSSDVTINSTGSGTVNLGGISNSFTGDIDVQAGTLSLANRLALGAANTINVWASATFSRGSNGSSGTGQFGTVAGITGSGLVTRGTGGGTRGLDLTGSGNYVFSGSLQDGANSSANVFTIRISGGGTQTFSGIGTYTGATTLTSGTLKLDASTGSLGLTAMNVADGRFLYDNTTSTGVKTQGLGLLTFTGGGSGTIESVKGGATSATLTFANIAARGNQTTGNFIVAGGTNGVTNSIVLTGAAAGFINQGTYFNGADFAYVDSVGSFVRAADYGTDAGFVDAGASLTAANHNLVESSITGQATASVNTLKFGGAGTVDLTLANNATVTLTNGGLIRAGGSTTTITGSGTGGILTGNNGEYVIRTDSAADTLTINANLKKAQTNRLVKSGAGTLILGAVNAYDSGTYVNEGTLLINGTILGTVNVLSGATLGGTNGTIGGAVTVDGGGTLAPGSSPGILTVNNSVTLNDGSKFGLELNGTTPGALGYDQLVVGGSGIFSLTGTNNLEITLGFIPTLNDQFTIALVQGTDSLNTVGIFEQLNGVATPLAQDAIFTLGSTQLQISYRAEGTTFDMGAGLGNNVMLQVVPEPTTWALLAFSLTTVMVLRRRRKA